MSYFPNAVYHDDMDSTTMFLNYIREHQFIISMVWDREAEEMNTRLKQKRANAACGKLMVPGMPIYQARGREFCSTLCAMCLSQSAFAPRASAGSDSPARARASPH